MKEDIQNQGLDKRKFEAGESGIEKKEVRKAVKEREVVTESNVPIVHVSPEKLKKEAGHYA